jgi:hypothetical protein
MSSLGDMDGAVGRAGAASSGTLDWSTGAPHEHKDDTASSNLMGGQLELAV